MSVMHVYGSDSGAVMLIGEHKVRVLGKRCWGIYLGRRDIG